MATRRFDSTRTQAARASQRQVARTTNGDGGTGRVVTSVDPVQATTGSTTRRATESHVQGRTNTQRSDGSGSLKIPSPKSRKQTPLHARGMGLRAKFMLVLSCVTGVALVALGASLSLTTSEYLFGQKQQAGVEIARCAAQIGTMVHEHLKELKHLRTQLTGTVDLTPPTQAQVQAQIETALTNAKDWGNGNVSYSDILAVRFDCPDVPEISRAGIGDVENKAAIIYQWKSIYVPKVGKSIDLSPQDISLTEADLDNPDGTQSRIYRFKIGLDPSFGKATNRTDPANVRVDIAADSVTQVRNRLFVTIGVAVLIAIGMVIAVANWLAGNITRPLDLLVSDMKVVARGRLDHETRARSNDEIGMLAVEFNRLTNNLKIAQSALVEQEKAEYELSLAREVQRQLLPAEAPTIAGYDCAAFYQGAKAVSGDYFDFIPLGKGLWGFIIADVSGKGIPGSMVMAVTRTIVRLVANRYENRAADTLKETNRLIAKQIKRGMFVTAFYAILDEQSGRLTYASAGHNPMVIYRAATKRCELGTGKGIALGFNEGPLFDKTIQEHQTVLGHGDTMVIYTDGFPEAMNAQDVEFGEERFYGAIARNGHLDARGNISRVIEEVSKHRGEAEQSDDLTIIAVRREPGT